MIKVGIIGAGQLGQMLGHAGKSLGIECTFLDPTENPPARDAGPVIRRRFDDVDALRELASRVDVLTYEFENVPVSALEAIAGEIDIYPPLSALHYAQDRLVEKHLFQSLDIPVVPFRSVDSESDLKHSAEELGLPLILKTRRLGYDGKGQLVIRDGNELAQAWRELGTTPLIAEKMLDFDYEVSALAARNVAGDIVNYSLTENQHDGGILRTSRAPAGSEELTTLAQEYHSRLAVRLDFVGVLALELFVSGQDLLANEFAPRVHNSGHWTLEGAITSQFENHLRAVANLPLGDASAVGYVAMENLIGSMPADLQLLRDAGYYPHDYGKTPRSGRKLGHITIIAGDADGREQKLQALQQIMST